MESPVRNLNLRFRREWLFVTGLLASFGCQSTNFTEQGALLGGLTGAGVGAAIGDTNDNAAGGAAVGTVVGALTGATIGSGLDSVEANNQARLEQAIAQRNANPTTVDDTIMMARAGLGDQVIIQQLEANGVAGALSTSELITLKNEGVSDPVIQTMQRLASTPLPIQPARPDGVYVQEYYAYPCPPPYRWHRARWHPRCRPGVSWGVSFGH